MTWEPTGIGQYITDSSNSGDFNRSLPGMAPPPQDDPDWDPVDISTCPPCNIDREIENVLENRSGGKAEEMLKGEPENELENDAELEKPEEEQEIPPPNGLENDAEPEKPEKEQEIPPPSHQTKPITNNVITAPERTTIFIACDFFQEAPRGARATGRIMARGDRPCDIDPDDPRTRFVKERGSPDTEKTRMINAARVRKCRERAALGLITPKARRPTGSKGGTGRGRRKAKKP